MRLFFAIELPAEVQSALGKLRSAEPWTRDYRWVEPASMHITLAFLGEQPDEALASLGQIGEAAASANGAGKLSIGQPGSFGPRRAPRVLWVGLDGDLGKLRRLHQALSEGLQRHGFPVEERAFSPHITLARRRERADSGLPPIWPPAQQPHVRPAPLDKLTLFQSELSRAGARYTPVAQFPIMSP